MAKVPLPIPKPRGWADSDIVPKDMNDRLQHGNDRQAGAAATEGAYDIAQSMLTRNWMRLMSNTAHQREVADLEKAGLNPILSATGGSGASTPASVSPTAPAFGNAVGAMADRRASAKQAEQEQAFKEKVQGHVERMAQEQLKRSDAETDLVREKTNTERVNQAYMGHSAKQLQLSNLKAENDWQNYQYQQRMLNKVVGERGTTKGDIARGIGYSIEKVAPYLTSLFGVGMVGKALSPSNRDSRNVAYNSYGPNYYGKR